jgi:hypothetical protein
MDYLFLIVISLVVICYFSYKKQSKSKKEPFTIEPSPLVNKPKKCKLAISLNLPVDLARSAKSTRIFGRPNKCFSCERQIMNTVGEKYINYAFPSKCFSCEKESKDPYNEGPTKCFNCN